MLYFVNNFIKDVAPTQGTIVFLSSSTIEFRVQDLKNNERRKIFASDLIGAGWRNQPG